MRRLPHFPWRAPMAPRALSSAQSLWRNRNIYLSSNTSRGYAQATAQSNRPTAQPTPAQLLRFAIAGTTRVTGGKEYDHELDSELEGLYSSSWVSKSQKEFLFSNDTRLSLCPHPEDTNLSDILAAIKRQGQSREAITGLLRSIPTLKEALSQCHGRTQYEELLAAVNAIVTRFQTFDVRNPPELVILGLYYSSVCCSPAAFQHYVTRYSNSGFGALPYEPATEIIEHLISGLRSRISAEPDVYRNQFVESITGLDVNGVDIESRGALHYILDLAPDTPGQSFAYQYVILLGILGSTQRLLEIWGQIEARLRSGHTPAVLRIAAHCLQALIESGEPERALKAAKNISSFVDLNKFIPVSIWKGLLIHDSSGMLQDVATEATKASVLQSELRLVEANLGITWIRESVEGGGQTQQASDRSEVDHTGGLRSDIVKDHGSFNTQLRDVGPENESRVREDAQFSGSSNLLGLGLIGDAAKAKHSLFAIADLMDSYGDDGHEFGDVEAGGQLDGGGPIIPGWTQQLLDVTSANGSSSSKSSLSTIADLLNEYEGQGVPLRVDKNLQQEFMWFPRCSPIEFVNKETPAGFDMSVPWSAASLGLIRARPDCDGVPLNFGRHIHLMQLGYISSRNIRSVEKGTGGDVQRWTNTGHVIGWDRLNECFVLLWVGKGHGTINPGLLRSSPSPPLPYSSALIGMRQSNGVSHLDIDTVRSLNNTHAYWLDVDPGLDLQP